MTATDEQVRIAIIGSGFSGLGMAIRLQQEGVEDFVVLERAQDVGGTWEANTYPGCQCDVPSHLYSFSFAPNPDWSHTYSPQPEIWDYLRRVADEHGVRDKIRFGCEVTGGTWDEDAGRWRLETSDGPLSAQFVIGAMGPLSEPSMPELPGLDKFKGAVFHSARWDHDHNLAGERVAVIGTGASAIQFVPKIQPEVAQMHVFQRTPPWVLPHSDRPTTSLERRIYRRFPLLQRIPRAFAYLSREIGVPGFMRNGLPLPLLQAMASGHIRRQVADPALRREVTPDYSIGCKRILPSNRWYPAITKPNVELVTAGVGELRESSIVDADGVEREIDTVILGTGFRITDMPAANYVRGREGRTLGEVWQGSPQCYAGTTIAGFPNLFMMLGANTGLGHNSMVYMIESQIAYVLDALRLAETRDLASIEVRVDAQERYNAKVQRALEGSVWNAGGCSSWYLDKNGRNTTVWPGFTWLFRRRLARFDVERYSVREREPVREPVAA